MKMPFQSKSLLFPIKDYKIPRPIPLEFTGCIIFLLRFPRCNSLLTAHQINHQRKLVGVMHVLSLPSPNLNFLSFRPIHI